MPVDCHASAMATALSTAGHRLSSSSGGPAAVPRACTAPHFGTLLAVLAKGDGARRRRSRRPCCPVLIAVGWPLHRLAQLLGRQDPPRLAPPCGTLVRVEGKGQHRNGSSSTTTAAAQPQQQRNHSSRQQAEQVACPLGLAHPPWLTFNGFGERLVARKDGVNLGQNPGLERGLEAGGVHLRGISVD